MKEHEKLRSEAEQLLNSWGRAGKNPSAMAKAMSTVKTDLTLMNSTEQDAAELVSKGCSMGIDKLRQSMDKYAAADGGSRKLTRELISAEQRLMTDLKNICDWIGVLAIIKLLKLISKFKVLRTK